LLCCQREGQAERVPAIVLVECATGKNDVLSAAYVARDDAIVAETVGHWNYIHVRHGESLAATRVVELHSLCGATVEGSVVQKPSGTDGSESAHVVFRCRAADGDTCAEGNGAGATGAIAVSWNGFVVVYHAARAIGGIIVVFVSGKTIRIRSSYKPSNT